MTGWKVCRLCLKDDENVLQEHTTSDNIIESIFIFTSLQVLQWPIESIYLCDECEELVIKFVSFRENCLANDGIFRQRIQEETLKRVDPIDTNVEENPAQTQTMGNERSNRKKNKSKQPQKKRLERNHSGTAKLDAIEDKKTGQKTTSSKLSRSISERTLPCTQCGKMVKRRYMNKHVLTHSSDIPVKSCSHCGKLFKNMHLLKVHINSHHTFEKKYECADCGWVYYRPNSLREHVYSKHSTEKRFNCGVCGLKFSNFARKQYHYVHEHTVTKPFACQYCEKAFKFKGDLTVHTRTHTGEKPFACDICGKTFCKSYNVVIHKKTHANRLIKLEVVNADSETTNQNK